jgi:mono/diheme cytochrome c family protein
VLIRKLIEKRKRRRRLKLRRISLERTSGGIVNRNFIVAGIAVLAVAGAVFAQDPDTKPAAAPAKKAAGGSGASAAAAARGKEVFDKKCGVCHYADSDAKKIGPGLKGLSKRGTFTVKEGYKVTDESLKTWIENGDSLMPPFKEVLEPAQIKDVVAYVKTL